MMTLQNILTTTILSIPFSLFGQSSSNDTVFIQKDSLLGTAQSIYFDKNEKSKFYNNIIDFRLFDKRSYNNSLKYLKENKLKLVKTNPIIPWTKWATLRQYKGKLYAYYPCDFYTQYKSSINDTTYIDWTGEGIIANKIIEQKKINGQTYQFKLANIYSKDRTLIIHMINEKKGIAIFEEIYDGVGNSYFLMIDAEKIRNVPLIVNNCETRKQAELHFEEPNYIELLNKK